MGKTSAPPLNGELILSTRLSRFLTQTEVAERVQEHCAADDIKFAPSSLSLIERSKVQRPNLKVVRALAAVLELEVDQMFKAAGGSPAPGSASDTAENVVTAA